MPYNLALHEHLLALGYRHQHNEAEFDDGDPENGPGTWGHPAWDEYQGPDEYVFAGENGVLDRQARDLEAEKFFEGMEIVSLSDPVELHRAIKNAVGE